MRIRYSSVIHVTAVRYRSVGLPGTLRAADPHQRRVSSAADRQTDLDQPVISRSNSAVRSNQHLEHRSSADVSAYCYQQATAVSGAPRHIMLREPGDLTNRLNRTSRVVGTHTEPGRTEHHVIRPLHAGRPAGGHRGRVLRHDRSYDVTGPNMTSSTRAARAPVRPVFNCAVTGGRTAASRSTSPLSRPPQAYPRQPQRPQSEQPRSQLPEQSAR